MLKILGLILAVVVVGVFFAFWFFRPVFNFDDSDVPRDLITSQFIDLDRVYAISKFRSGAGHDFSYGEPEETCRSMKHYFNVGRYEDSPGKPARSKPTATESNIKIYAPLDGRIMRIDSGHLGVEFHIRPDQYPYLDVRISHIDALPGIGWGDKVKAGQWIATIGPKDGTEIALEVNSFTGKTRHLSYFDLMDDDVFESYAKMGYKKEDFIITKEYRDAHPFKCGGTQTHPLIKSEETFNHPKGRSWTQDFVWLKPDPHVYEDQY